MKTDKPIATSLSSLTLPTFNQQYLWLQALTHRSYAHEHPGSHHNERLEFLGDSILGFLVAELLYEKYPHFREAELTRLRSQLVNEDQLAQFARALGIGEVMCLGKGAEQNGERDNPSLLSNTLEAIIGAYFLDSGLAAVRFFVQALVLSDLTQLPAVKESPPSSLNSPPSKTALIDVKNQLQQWALAHCGELPQYFLIETTGPDHAKEFTFGVRIHGKPYGQGKGQSKQDATKAAALQTLKQLGLI
jgi:ribonuclease-3